MDRQTEDGQTHRQMMDRQTDRRWMEREKTTQSKRLQNKDRHPRRRQTQKKILGVFPKQGDVEQKSANKGGESPAFLSSRLPPQAVKRRGYRTLFKVADTQTQMLFAPAVQLREREGGGGGLGRERGGGRETETERETETDRQTD